MRDKKTTSKTASKKTASKAKAPPGQRQLRVAERIRHVLARVMMDQRLDDPLLAKSSLISVTAVEIGPDLKHATAFIMPLGGKNADQVVEALNKASGFFRSIIAPELEMRYTPKVSFRIDHSFEEAAHIDKILRQERVQKDIEKKREEEEADAADEDEA